MSDLTFCEDCECAEPNGGCGWKADKFGRVECTTCDDLRSEHNAEVVSYFEIIKLIIRLLLLVAGIKLGMVTWFIRICHLLCLLINYIVNVILK
jgi:hypothetical protein